MDDALRTFVERWVRARSAVQRAQLDGAGGAEALAALGSLVTTREPYATCARADLDLLARGYMPFGVGMAAEIEQVSAQPFDGWTTTVSPLVFRLSWSHDMSGTQGDASRVAIDRVALEPSGFRVVSVFDQVARERAVLEAEIVALARKR
jgi:hypothetical protein